MSTSRELLPKGDHRRKLNESIVNGLRQIHQRLNKWKCLEELNLAKEYANGQIGILVEFGCESRPHTSNSSGARWVHAKTYIYQRHENLTVWANDFKMPHAGHPNNGREHFMLLGIIEQMETVQFLSRTAWTCRQGEKEFLRVGAGCFYSMTRGFVILPVLTEGEGRTAVLYTAVYSDQFPHSVVKGRPQIMNRITQDQGQVMGNWLAQTNLDGEGASLRIVLGEKFMGVALNKGVKCTPEISDVLFGPFDLAPGAVKHGALSRGSEGQSAHK